MAFGTLSACLPTYRPILHHAFGRKSPLTTTTAKLVPSQELSALTNSKRAGLKTTTTSSHPFCTARGALWRGQAMGFHHTCEQQQLYNNSGAGHSQRGGSWLEYRQNSD